MYPSKLPYVPSVKIKSSQQLCLPTSPLQASPVLSAMVADVPVVRMLSGRDGESWGGWSDMVEAVAALYRWLLRVCLGIWGGS